MDAALDAGMDAALDAGELPDAGTDGGDVHDGAAPSDGSARDAGPPFDAGPPGCDLGQLECGGTCVDGVSDPTHCGACDVRCGATEVCAGGVCAPTCEAPRQVCDGLCIDTRNDPDHCGGCGITCVSGLCIDGLCSDPVAGHVVLVGHDYESSRPGMNRVIGNAVFLARSAPVDVLVWEGTSTEPSRAGTDAAIRQVATATGRAWTRQAVFDAGKVPVGLVDAEVFLVYAQRGSDDDELRGLGALWSTALATFVARGGVVIVLDTMGPTNSGSWQITSTARLLTAFGRSEATGAVLRIAAPADAVALGVPLMYSAERTSVWYDSDEATAVVVDGMGRPVVIHRTVLP
jgi:hypothetical protein